MSSLALKRRRSCAALLLGALLLSSPSFASDKTAARAAASAGADALKAGEYQKAISYFKRAEATFHAPTHLLGMAQASIQLKQLVEAREHLLQLVNEGLSDSAPPAFQQAKEKGRKLLVELEPRIPKLTVELEAPDAEGIEVLIDDKPLPQAALGVSYPVNPGAHRLVARAGKLESTPTEVSLEEGQSEHVLIRFDIRRASAASSPEPQAQAPLTSVESAEPGVETPSRMPWLIAGSAVTLAGAGVGIAGGVIAFNRQKSISDEYCIDNRCSPDAEDEIKKAKTWGTLSTVGFAVGAAGVGVLLYGVFLPQWTSETKSPELAVLLPQGGAGLSATWRH